MLRGHRRDLHLELTWPHCIRRWSVAFRILAEASDWPRGCRCRLPRGQLRWRAATETMGLPCATKRKMRDSPQHHRRSGLRALAGLVALSFLLSGCEDDKFANAPSVRAFESTPAPRALESNSPDSEAQEPGLRRTYRAARPTPADQPGPVFGSTQIFDRDVRFFDDLAKYYPLAPGYRYERTDSGQPFVRRLTDQARFSFLIESRKLTFDIRRWDERGFYRYDTSEVFHRDDIADSCTRESWKMSNGACVTGFASKASSKDARTPDAGQPPP